MSFTPFSFMPKESPLPAPWSRTVTTALASGNAIKTSIATAITAQSYSTVGLNGAIGQSQFALPQTVSVTTSSHSGSYIITSPIVVTGLDPYGNTITENLTLTQVNGNETIQGVKSFAQVTKIDVPPMTDTSGAFTFGVGDVLLPSGTFFRKLRSNSAGDIKVGFQDGTTDTIHLLAGETVNVLANRIYSTGTSATALTAFA